MRFGLATPSPSAANPHCSEQRGSSASCATEANREANTKEAETSRKHSSDRDEHETQLIAHPFRGFSGPFPYVPEVSTDRDGQKWILNMTKRNE